MKIGAERAKDRKRERKKECEMPPKRADSCQRQVKPYTLRESVIGSFPIRFNVILFFSKLPQNVHLAGFQMCKSKKIQIASFFTWQHKLSKFKPVLPTLHNFFTMTYMF
jgi:hypothetical protein